MISDSARKSDEAAAQLANSVETYGVETVGIEPKTDQSGAILQLAGRRAYHLDINAYRSDHENGQRCAALPFPLREKSAIATGLAGHLPKPLGSQARAHNGA